VVEVFSTPLPIMIQSLGFRMGMWLITVFVMASIFGWDVLHDMKKLSIEASTIETVNHQSHTLHQIELELLHSLNPVKDFLITGDYRLEALFLRRFTNLSETIQTYEQHYPAYSLDMIQQTMDVMRVNAMDVFHLPYAVGNMEGPILLQEILQQTKHMTDILSVQHHRLDDQVDAAMHMMSGLRMDMRDESGVMLLVLLLVLLSFTYSIYTRIILPLVRMRHVVDHLSRGDFTVRTVYQSGDEIGALAAAFNQMGHELELRESKLNQAQSLAAYQEKMSVLGLMAGGIAHEVGNPLSAISVSLQVAERKLVQRDYQAVDAQLKMAFKETQRMESMIQTILKFARHEHKPMIQSCHMLPLIEEARQLALFSPGKKMSINIHIPSELPMVIADDGMLLQVLLNLMLNAMDASREHDAIDIRIFQHSIETICIQVMDQGEGIEEKFQSEIFKPNFTSKPLGQGTGLGLAISKELIASMGGDLTLMHSDMSGSCFQISLKIQEDMT